MNAERELIRAYCEWRRLVLAEAKAIQTCNWRLFSDCHQAIKDYQAIVPGLTREVRSVWQRSGGDQARKEEDLRVIVSSLLDLTRENQRLLQTSKERVQAKIENLRGSRKNLGRLRTAYGGGFGRASLGRGFAA